MTSNEHVVPLTDRRLQESMLIHDIALKIGDGDLVTLAQNDIVRELQWRSDAEAASPTVSENKADDDNPQFAVTKNLIRQQAAWQSGDQEALTKANAQLLRTSQRLAAIIAKDTRP